MLAYSKNTVSQSNIGKSENQCTELVWPTAHELNDIARWFSQLLAKWSLDWSINPVSDYRVSVQLAHESQSGYEQRWRRFGEENSCVWMLGFANISGLVDVEIFGEYMSSRSGSALAPRIVEDAQRDLMDKLLAGLALEATLALDDAVEEMIPANKRKLWSGTICLCAIFGRGELTMLVDWNVLKPMLSVTSKPDLAQPKMKQDKSPLVPILQSVKHESVRLHVELNPVELDLANLRNLSIGDVLRLGHSLDEPIKVQTLSGEQLCFAYLGKYGDQKAIELLKPM